MMVLKIATVSYKESILCICVQSTGYGVCENVFVSFRSIIRYLSLSMRPLSYLMVIPTYMNAWWSDFPHHGTISAF